MACIPFAALFTPVALKICAEAIAVGIGCWGAYQGTKHAAEAVGSPYTLSESGCYALVNNALDVRYDYTKMDRPTKKHEEKKYPGSPQDLEKNPDWRETTHPGEAKSGRRVFENTETGEKIEYDKGKPGRSGHGAHDHYHRPNPNSQGKGNEYLDKDGNPTRDHSDSSHLYPPEGVSWE